MTDRGLLILGCCDLRRVDTAGGTRCWLADQPPIEGAPCAVLDWSKLAPIGLAANRPYSVAIKSLFCCSSEYNTFACSVIGSRMDYCNSLLLGVSKQNLDRLQRVQNKAAQIVCNASRQIRSTTSPPLLHLINRVTWEWGHISLELR